MSRTEDIDNGIWDDPDFAALSPYATLLYIWSWTNPRCGWSGLYKVPFDRMAESKVPVERIQAALDELSAPGAGFLFYEAGVLWVRARVKRLRSRSPQMAKAVAKDLEHIPADHPLRVKFLETYGDDSWLKDTLPIPSKNPIGPLSNKSLDKGNLHTPKGPYRKGPGTGEGIGTGDSSSNNYQLPGSYPSELTPHFGVILPALTDLAVRHNARRVESASVAAVIMANAHKPLVRSLFGFIAWADGKAERRKDVVAGYRNWLAKADDLAGYEELGADGMPGRSLSVLNGGDGRNPKRFDLAARAKREAQKKQRHDEELGGAA